MKNASELSNNPILDLSIINPKTTLAENIYRTWGQTLGDDILEFIYKWNIDFYKLINRLKQKGQNIYSGMGAALALDDYGYVTQCSCGDVMGFSSEIVDPLLEVYNGDIKCKYCDPELSNKIQKIVGGVVRDIPYDKFRLNKK
jgi:hypothetical protein